MSQDNITLHGTIKEITMTEFYLMMPEVSLLK